VPNSAQALKLRLNEVLKMNKDGGIAGASSWIITEVDTHRKVIWRHHDASWSLSEPDYIEWHDGWTQLPAP
jgi:hypothetical protein